MCAIVFKVKERSWGLHGMNNNHEPLDTAPGLFLILVSFGAGGRGLGCLSCKQGQEFRCPSTQVKSWVHCWHVCNPGTRQMEMGGGEVGGGGRGVEGVLCGTLELAGQPA